MSDLRQDIKDAYYKELERRDSIVNSTSMPMGLMPILFTLLFFIFSKIEKEISLNSIAAYEFSLIGFYCLTVSCIYLSMAVWSHDYNFIPHMTSIIKYKSELIESATERETEETAEKKATNHLYDQYAECATLNAIRNKFKAESIYECKKWLMISLGIIMTSGLLIIPNLISNDSSISISITKE
ncbi:hypothetical protein [Asticcacaulis sp. AND118]|uniref:hypothetical protein n=1 Tax=Asticcacaulis sp. AND118 TaxID=2840468 RepID=UPI001CFF6E57|nr:hypothetical protein [Asticcacaulis sp. AND118]UDF05404.1 hypothetical protein LH365_14445 [Asticcacaulis sp. AND118]